jgi:TetR/AcrR family transcriptional regulator
MNHSIDDGHSSICFAPIAMPQLVRDILGDDPLAPETRHRLHRQLIRLLGGAGE